MGSSKNVFEAILRYGHDEDFVPEPSEDFVPTDAPAGSPEKIEVLRRRVEKGQPLWHAGDRVDYTGLTASIVPRIDQVGTVNKKKPKPSEKTEKPPKANNPKNVPKPEAEAADPQSSVANDMPSNVILGSPSTNVPESSSEVAVATESVQTQVQKLFKGPAVERIARACAKAKIRVLHNISEQLPFETFLGKLSEFDVLPHEAQRMYTNGATN